MKIYIHKSNCIWPQVALEDLDASTIRLSENNRLTAIEPAYDGIPRGVLRRMGKAVRIGVGAAMPLIEGAQLDGIILGTANGGMEDCVRFFNQIIDYDEGNLTPTNFVQSTTNAIASQIGLMAGNKGHNNTHVHAGLAFENALIDAHLQLMANPENSYLLGGVDEISDYNYNIDLLGGWNKKEIISSEYLYQSHENGSIAGEGAAMFVVSGNESGAQSVIEAMETLPTDNIDEVAEWQQNFIESNFRVGQMPDLIVSGENGDPRELNYYENLENALSSLPVVRYKHLSGELPTANAIGLWLANQILQKQVIPDIMIKRGKAKQLKSILIYNVYHQSQHSLMLLKVIK